MSPHRHPIPADHVAAVPGAPEADRLWFEGVLDRGLIPDAIMRAAIRHRLALLLAHHERGDLESRHERFGRLLADLRRSPVAIHPDAANRQHYEVPAEFFRLCLGPRMKYSSCYWPDRVDTLAEAEEAMLRLTCERAGIRDGQHILELGCGWGSLTLWILEKFPNCRVTAVSNSHSQRRFIAAEAERRGLRAPEVITADMRDFELDRRFDRVVSVEMFEHMKNYAILLQRIARMLAPGGMLFVHIFTHTRVAYHFESGRDWMAKYFFTGGIMPSDHLLHHFQESLTLRDHWRIDGRHYQKTASAWLAGMDRNRAEIRRVFADVYGPEAPAWFHRWRVFFMACAEVWGFRGGGEWIVSHYLFQRPAAGA